MVSPAWKVEDSRIAKRKSRFVGGPQMAEFVSTSFNASTDCDLSGAC